METKTSIEEGGDVYLASIGAHVHHDVWLIDRGASFHMRLLIGNGFVSVKSTLEVMSSLEMIQQPKSQEVEESSCFSKTK